MKTIKINHPIYDTKIANNNNCMLFVVQTSTRPKYILKYRILRPEHINMLEISRYTRLQQDRTFDSVKAAYDFVRKVCEQF